MAAEPLLVSVADAAAATGLSASHVRRHAPIVRVGRRSLVPVAWLHGLAHRVVE